MSQPLSAAALQDPAVLQLPALTAPPGVVPNFTNPISIGPRLIVSGAILLTFVIVALAGRAYTKLYIIRKVSLDDLTIFLAAFCAIASYSLCVYGNGSIKIISTHTDKQFFPEVRLGFLGRHLYEIRLGEYLNNKSSRVSKAQEVGLIIKTNARAGEYYTYFALRANSLAYQRNLLSIVSPTFPTHAMAET